MFEAVELSLSRLQRLLFGSKASIALAQDMMRNRLIMYINQQDAQKSCD